MKTKLYIAAALLVVVAGAGTAVAFALSKPGVNATDAASVKASCCPDGACCPDGPCCTAAVAKTEKKASCCSTAKKTAVKKSCCPDGACCPDGDCCDAAAKTTTVKASCCPDGDCCPNGACCTTAAK